MLPLSWRFVDSLDVKVFEAIPVQHHDAGFFRVRGIDQHTLGHQGLNSGAPPVAA